MDTSAAGGGIDVTGPATGAERPDVEVRRDDVPVLVPGPAERSRRVTRLALALLAALLVAVAGALWLLRDGGDDVATVPAAGGPGRAEPAALTVQVDPPTTAVAGQPVTITVHYADGRGVFSGSTEDWGDGVGVGSGKTGSCAAAAPARALSDSYQATHTFAAPGNYPVAIEVTTYVCEGGSVVEEHARATVDLTVTAP